MELQFFLMNSYKKIIHTLLLKHHIGKEFIKYLINWAQENKFVNKISLRVRADNQSAIHVYKKLGFQEERFLKAEMMCTGILYDLIYMGFMVN